jgi:adenylyltransferase/sulfurtransferase
LVPSCQEAGVLGALAGVIGLIQATETLKLILEIGEPLVGKFILFDALGMNLTRLNVKRNEDCPVCSEKSTIKNLTDYEQFCGQESSSRPSVR